MNERQEQSNTIMEIWNIFLQYRWRFILPAFIITTGALAAGFVLPRQYRASAQFERRTDMVMTEISTKGASNTFQDPKSILTEELKGQPAIDALMKTLEPKFYEMGVISNDADKTALRRRITKRTIVHWDISTRSVDRIRLEYVDSNPELAKLVVNTLIENYIKRSRELMNGRLEQAASFFKNEVVNNRNEIEQYENNVLEFEIKYSELLPENPNNIQTKITVLQENLTELVSEREAALAKVQALQQSISGEPQTIPSTIMGRNPELERLENKKNTLSEQFVKFTSVLKMKRRHPDMVALEAELAELETTIENTPKEIVIERQTTSNPKLAELELRQTTAKSEYDALMRHTSAMEEQLAGMQLEANKIYEVRSAYRKLQRQVQESQRQIAFWEDNLRRVEMSHAAEAGNKGIQLMFLNPATTVFKPVSPNWLQLLIAAICLGIFCGTLNIYVSYRTNEAFNDGEQAANYCDIQLFGSVSEIISTQQRKVRKLRNMILYPTNAIIMGTILLTLSAMLYIDLEKPELFHSIVSKANKLLTPESATAAELSITTEESDSSLTDLTTSE
ncbi:hypothetical protein JD969_00870 [Planctomycetota bacterium]|nr:hypothetical protein JD969_00870 [Planctomycetota bacterium]